MKKLALIIIILILVAGSVSAVVGYKEFIEDDDDDEPKANRAPKAVIEFEPENPKTNQEISFSAVNSTDPDKDDLTYSWEFGDGETGSKMEVDHTYAVEGTYEVNLTVTDEEGLNDTVSMEVEVIDPRVDQWWRDGNVNDNQIINVNPSEDEGWNVDDGAIRVYLQWNLTGNDGGDQVTIGITDGNGTEQDNQTYDEGQGFEVEYTDTDSWEDGNWNWHIEIETGDMDYELYIRVEY